MRKTIKIIIFLSLITILITALSSSYVSADTQITPLKIGDSDPGSEEKLKDVARRIDELEVKLKEVRDRGKTLKSQISYMDNQIKLTNLKIEETENQIVVLKDQIKSLSNKIAKLETSLTSVSEILLNRIVATYKTGDISPIYILLSSDGFGNYFTKAKYVQVAQEHDKKLMFSMQSAKNSYEVQKNLREEKKEKLEYLQKQLEDQKNVLGQQSNDKKYLLEVTQQDEKRYQELIAAAKAEQTAIESAMRQVMSLLKDGTPVNKGDQIALVGNSGAPGCSTGTHLHFEIRKNETVQNPSDYLKSTPVIWNNQPDGEFSFNGDWDWPVDSPRITQGYGMTYWARTGFYGGNAHSGIDIVPESSSVIHAPKEGTLYKGTVSCKGSPMNFVAIKHDNELVSWYWHVQ